MSDSPVSPATSISDPKTLSRDVIFGPAPLLPGEDAAAYAELLAQVSAVINPASIIEEMWVRDVVYLTWEIWRLRRFKANLISNEIPNQLGKILGQIINKGTPIPDILELELSLGFGPPPLAYELAQKWAAKDPDAVTKVDELLASAEMTIGTAVTKAFANQLDDLERTDRLIENQEARRNFVLREIDRYRTAFAYKLRSTVQEIEDAEFETIEATLVKSKNPKEKKAKKPKANNKKAA